MGRSISLQKANSIERLRRMETTHTRVQVVLRECADSFLEGESVSHLERS